MNQDQILETGKLPIEFLERLLKEYCPSNSDVIVGPGVGHDAAVIDLGDIYLIAKTDPITFATEDIGFYAVNINANDIACMGGVPKWFLATLLLPDGKTDYALVEKIFQQLAQTCRQMKIAWCGGHTEVTHGLQRPIIVGQMLGTVSKENLVRPSGVQVGDDIILTAGIAIEGTTIIAREKFSEIVELFSDEFAQRCLDFLHTPGISIVKAAHTAQVAARIHAMHDPTEGGLSMGLYELALASNKVLRVEMEKIPILPEAKLLCDVYDLDILGTIASGSLLLTVSQRFSQIVIDALESQDIPASVIGKVIGNGAGVQLVIDNEEIEMPRYTKDEILRIFEKVK